MVVNTQIELFLANDPIKLFTESNICIEFEENLSQLIINCDC